MHKAGSQKTLAVDALNDHESYASGRANMFIFQDYHFPKNLPHRASHFLTLLMKQFQVIYF